MWAEVGLACSRVRGRPVLPPAPKSLRVYSLGVRTHQGSTGVRRREHGGSPKPLRRSRNRMRGNDRRDWTGFTGLISVYVVGMTYTPVWEGGGRFAFKCVGGSWVGVFTCAGATHFTGSAEVVTGLLTRGTQASMLHWGKTLGAWGGLRNPVRNFDAGCMVVTGETELGSLG